LYENKGEHMQGEVTGSHFLYELLLMFVYRVGNLCGPLWI